jgi:hypothetical protein
LTLPGGGCQARDAEACLLRGGLGRQFICSRAVAAGLPADFGDLLLGLGDAGLELDANGDVVLRLKYSLGAAVWTSEGRGETVVVAHPALLDQLVLDRLRLGFRAMYLATR